MASFAPTAEAIPAHQKIASLGKERRAHDDICDDRSGLTGLPVPYSVQISACACQTGCATRLAIQCYNIHDMPERNNRTVYSTDPNFKLCPRCGNYPCRCRKPKSLPPGDQTASILRERKGRGGKTVIVVRGLVLAPDDLKALVKQLKLACGTGGTVKGETIEIQGDHREKVAETLHAIGYKTKMVGG